MRLLHVLHIVALCCSLAWQLQRRAVTWELLPERPAASETTLLDSHDFAPFIEIESPLYRALINRETRCCVWISFRVRAEDVAATHETDRRWWHSVELAPYCLESDDFTGSGYDRGHLRSLAMSRGSEHWRDVNFMPVIVAERPELNRGPIQQLEQDICQLATEHGWCDVTIHLSGDVGDMANADEPHAIPQTIHYVIESPAGVRSETFDNREP